VGLALQSAITITGDRGAIDGLWALPGGELAVASDGGLALVRQGSVVASVPAEGLTDVVPLPGGPPGRVAAIVPSGVRIVRSPDLETVATLQLERRPLGADLVDGDVVRNRERDLLREPRLFVATRGGVVSIGGIEGDAPFVEEVLDMPGPVRDVRWNEATNLVHVLGEEQGHPTLYVVEPHGTTVFADAELPLEPVAWDLDVRREEPTLDRQRAILVAEDGEMAAVRLGGTQSAARAPGALAGALSSAFLYLLLRLVFRRRAIAVVGGSLFAVETLLLAQSRIATPDTFLVALVLAAYLALAAVLSRPPGPRRTAWLLLGMPIVGLLLGLAGSTKWLGWFALGGVLLFLALLEPRTRLVALATATIAGTLVVLDAVNRGLDISVVAVVGLGLAVIAVWAWRWQRMGSPPLVSARVVVWGLVSIPVVAAITYALSYLPYVFLDRDLPQLVAGWPPDHHGETVLDAQARMLAYHAGLAQEHGAGSPWWSWPLVLKPVWAYLESFTGGSASILMPANPVVLWAGSVAAAWAVIRLARRLHPGILLLLVAATVQWLPWARVERVTFLYHVVTAVPFVAGLLAAALVALVSRRTARSWVAARVAVVVAASLPAILWLALRPLCQGLATEPDAGGCAGRLDITLRGPWGDLAIGSTWTLTLAWLLVALPVGAFALLARSPRQLVAGTLVAAVAAAVLLSPVLVGVPVSLDAAILYQALLPTWDSTFQFHRGPGGLPVALVWIGLPCLLIGATAAWAIRRLDARRGGLRDADADSVGADGEARVGGGSLH
jgi:hypothetical protein